MKIFRKGRKIHRSGKGSIHPFKAHTLCGLLVRFGGMEITQAMVDEERALGEDDIELRPVTCKACMRLIAKAEATKCAS